MFIKLITKMKRRIDKPEHQHFKSNCLAVHFSVYTVG